MPCIHKDYIYAKIFLAHPVRPVLLKFFWQDGGNKTGENHKPIRHYRRCHWQGLKLWTLRGHYEFLSRSRQNNKWKHSRISLNSRENKSMIRRTLYRELKNPIMRQMTGLYPKTNPTSGKFHRKFLPKFRQNFP